jgi:hypothetical protein
MVQAFSYEAPFSSSEDRSHATKVRGHRQLLKLPMCLYGVLSMLLCRNILIGCVDAFTDYSSSISSNVLLSLSGEMRFASYCRQIDIGTAISSKISLTENL